MSLLRLLSTGRSWVGDKTDNSNRYQMGNPGLLPKFGRIGASPASKRERQVLPTVEPAAGKAAEPVAQRPPIEHVPSTPSKEKPENPKGALKRKLSFRERYRGWLERLKDRIYVKPHRVGANRLSKAPIQTELSLDNVRVVRNDLSDSDVEVVPARRESKRSPAGASGLRKGLSPAVARGTAPVNPAAVGCVAEQK